MRVSFILLTISLLLYPLQSEARISEIKKYDAIIEDATKRYWPDIPIPELLKAQLYQESRLDPNAVSPVGARGIGQFMPKTWAEVAKALGFTEADVVDPRRSIRAGAYYMATLRRSKILRSFTEPDRHKLAQASYNAGLGNIQKAIKRSGKLGLSDIINGALPQITGRHAKETQTYVERIWKYYNELMEDTTNSTDSHRRSLVLDDLLNLRGSN